MKLFRSLVTVILLLLFGTSAPLMAQAVKTDQQQEEAFKQVLRERADKIVKALDIADKAKETKVRDMIADQYFNLNKIQSKRDALIKSLKPENKAGIEAARTDADLKIAKLHNNYLSNLATHLSAQQIEKVKDGMTYNVVPLTFQNYLLQTPYLTKTQQEKIMALLIEAREHAMDGGSSKEKHGWFGKYKGKITNYLAAEGYNLKKESSEWAKRRDTKSDALEITKSNQIISRLNIEDNLKREIVRNLIAHQYQKIMEIQTERELKVEQSNQLLKNKEEADKAAAAIWADYQQKFAVQRDLFSNALSAHLDPAKVEMVKNEMTGNSLQKEYAHFLALLPHLTEVQKKKVYGYLLEARDNAMNVLTSRQQNQWFAKFRGRANNYLAKEGYNLRKATEDLEKHTNNSIK